MKIAEAIVSDILEELGGRGGFDNWWDEIDRWTKAEIRQTMVKIVLKHLEGADGR